MRKLENGGTMLTSQLCEHRVIDKNGHYIFSVQMGGIPSKGDIIFQKRQYSERSTAYLVYRILWQIDGSLVVIATELDWPNTYDIYKDGLDGNS